VEQLSGKPVELGPAPRRGRVPGRLVDVVVSRQLVPVPAGQGSSHSTWSWSPAGPDGQGKSKGPGSGCPTHSWGSAGPEGRWVRQGAGIPVSCGTGFRLRSGTVGGQGSQLSWIRQRSRGAGILVWCGSSWGLDACMAEGWVFQWYVDPAWPERWGSRHVWIQHGVLAWRSLRGGEPGKTEQRFCRPMGQGFCRPAVLLLDCGMEKASTI
jgi:hypothetical protein